MLVKVRRWEILWQIIHEILIGRCPWALFLPFEAEFSMQWRGFLRLFLSVNALLNDFNGLVNDLARLHALLI
jgi:hypothetical protein